MRPLTLLALFTFSVLLAAHGTVALDVVFSDWKHSLDTWTVGSDLYFVSFDQRYLCFNSTYELDDDFIAPSSYVQPTEIERKYERILLSRNKQNFIISYEDCTQDQEFAYCFDGVDCSDSRTKYEGGERYSGVKISITKILPELVIEREFTPASVEYGDEIRVDVTLRNKGNSRMDYVEYWDPYPADFKVVPNYPVVLTDSNKIHWNGWLDAGDNASITYYVTPYTYTDFKSTTNATFRSKQKTSSVTNENTIDLKTPYELTLITPDVMSVNDVSTISFEIENTQTNIPLDVANLKITLPEELAFEGFFPAGVLRLDQLTRELVRDGNTFAFTGRIGPEEAKKFYLRVRGLVPATATTTVSIGLAAEGKTFNQTLTKSTKIEFQDITPTIRLEPEVTKGGGTVRLIAYLDNGEKNAYANLRLTLASDLFGSLEFREAEIRRGERLNLIVQDFTTPSVDQNMSYLITLDGDYITFTGTPHQLHKEATLLVSTDKPPRTHSFTITHILSNQTASPGDTITVTTQVKNQAGEPARGISIEDRFSLPVDLVAGVTQKDLDLEAQESRQVYVYKIRIPDDTTASRLDVASFLTFQDLTLEETAQVTIDRSSLISDTDTPAEGEQTNTTPSDIDSENSEAGAGFFTRIWSWLKGLFS